MGTNRKAWNLRQKALRQALLQPERAEEAIDLFLDQHAALHSAGMTHQPIWSFSDAILAGLSEAGQRLVPAKQQHSIAWCFWHMARIEDVTMNLLVAGRPQVLYEGDWLTRMQITNPDTGNDLDAAEVAGLSAGLDLGALQDYRLAVGLRTRETAAQLRGEALKRTVDPSGLQKIVDQGAVPAGSGLLAYWGRRTIAGLLLMPPTRHNFVHLNEARALKRGLR